MKEIKLTPVKIKKSPKDKYIIVVEFMHGDGDHYDTDEYKCKDDADFRRVIELLGDIPSSPGEGGDSDKYDEWELETFKSDNFIPHDITYNDIKTHISSFEAFYYDSNGNKFQAEII